MVSEENGTFERINLKIGISDGNIVEVISGINTDDKIKVWNVEKE